MVWRSPRGSNGREFALVSLELSKLVRCHLLLCSSAARRGLDAITLNGSNRRSPARDRRHGPHEVDRHFKPGSVCDRLFPANATAVIRGGSSILIPQDQPQAGFRPKKALRGFHAI
jgi:hypothetical protein